MATIRQCAQCGAGLPESVPDGQCPECLIQLGLMAGAASAADPSDGGFGLLPREFGDYTLLEEIARGGMGVVYRARQKSLGRMVAVKLILSGHLAGKDSIHRFRTEAASAAALQHPNIVAIHEVGVHQGEHYLAMDWVDGPNLAQFVKNTPLPGPRAALYLKTIAEAIHYAHERGILHRDLKPSNILIDPNDQPRVTDFGLAKRMVAADVRRLTSSSEPVSEKVSEPVSGSLAVEETPSHSPAHRPTDSPARNDQSLLTSAATEITVSGQVLGSPNYIPPEQASGKRGQVSRQSDVYSLGAILYHMLTDRGPFISDTVADVLQQVLHEEPVSPRLLNRSVPRDLETICLKCLEKEPARRYATARELAGELDRFLKDEPIQARPVSRAEKVWRWCRRKPALAISMIAAAVLLLFVAIGAPVAAFRINRERQRVQHNLVRQYVANGTQLMDEGDLFGSLLWYTEALKLDAGSAEREEPHRIRIASVLGQCPQLVNLISHGRVLHSAQFSPDGRWLLTGGDDHAARVWDLASGEIIAVLKHEDDVLHAEFSPDGRHIVTASEDHTAVVWEMPSARRSHPPFVHADAVTYASFSPDGRMMATAGVDGLVQRWDVETGAKIGDALVHNAEVVQLRFSADGRFLATAKRDGGTRGWDTGLDRRGVPGNYSGVACVWDTATGKLLFRAGHWAEAHGRPLSFSGDSRRFLTIEQLQVHVWETSRFSECEFSPITASQDFHAALFSPDGKRIATASRDNVVRIWDATTGSLASPPIPHHEYITDLDFSPDSRFLVTSSFDRKARVWSVATGRPVSPSLRHVSKVRSVLFNPDGRRFLSTDWDHAVRVWDLAPSGTVVPPSWAPARHVRITSPDARQLLTLGPSNSISIMGVATHQPIVELPHPQPVHYSSFSPDGRTVITACGSGRNDKSVAVKSELFLWNTAGRRLNARPIEWPFWLMDAVFSRDGSHVLILGPSATAQILDARDGRVICDVISAESSIDLGDFSPDGKSVFTASHEGAVHIWDSFSGKPTTTPLPHHDSVVGAFWSADGRGLHTTTLEHRRVWDIATGQPLTAPMPIAEPAGRAARSLSSANSSARDPTFASTSGVPPAGGAEPSLLPDQRRVTDLLMLARMFALSRLDAEGNQMPLDFNELMSSWKTLKGKYPYEFAVTPAAGATWDERAAARRRSSGNALDIVPARDARTGAECVDLSAHYNRALWQNFSPKDDANDLGTLPSGLQMLGGINFDVRGTLLLSGTMVKAEGLNLPQRIDGIRMGRRCRLLHFLQATHYDTDDEKLVGSYVLHYADGQTWELPIIHRRDTKGFWGEPVIPLQPDDATVVWTGHNRGTLAEHSRLRLFKSTRVNPRPEHEVVSIDFVSSMTTASPFLVALTVE